MVLAVTVDRKGQALGWRAGVMCIREMGRDRKVLRRGPVRLRHNLELLRQRQDRKWIRVRRNLIR